MVRTDMIVSALIGFFVCGPGSPGADLDRAERLWRSFGMQVPPAGSVAVLGPKYVGLYVSMEPDIVGFHSPAAGWFYFGASRFPAARIGKSYRKLAWPLASDPQLSFGLFPEETVLSGALMAKGLGQKDLALRLARQFASDPFKGWAYGLPKDSSLTAATAGIIATHLANQAMEPGTDREALLAAAKRLKDTGLIGPGDRLGGPYNLGSFIRGLSQPSRHAGSKAETAVEALLECSRRNDGSGYGPQYRAVQALGLAAVPYLLDRWDDHRLTRSFESGINFMPSHVAEMSELSRSLVADISGGRVLAFDGKAKALDWLRAAR